MLESSSAPDPRELVLWHLSPRQTIVIPRESADWLDAAIDAYDGIPFAWTVSGGYIIGLLPRRLWTVNQ